MVEKLTKRFWNTNRVVGMDNFFTSIPLAKTLFENNMGLIGTLKANKNQVPEEFLYSKEREVVSSLFGFSGPLSLTSFVPKVIY